MPEWLFAFMVTRMLLIIDERQRRGYVFITNAVESDGGEEWFLNIEKANLLKAYIPNVGCLRSVMTTIATNTAKDSLMKIVHVLVGHSTHVIHDSDHSTQTTLKA